MFNILKALFRKVGNIKEQMSNVRREKELRRMLEITTCNMNKECSWRAHQKTGKNQWAWR